MDIFFYCKRAVGMLVQPLPLVFLFLAVALALLVLTARKRAAAVCLALALAILFASSFPPLTRAVARSLEDAYRPLQAKAPDLGEPFAIVVLGNGVAHPGDGAMPALSRLNDTARARLAEGVRLAGVFPGARLITTGYGLGLENCADAMAGAAMELGVPPERIDRLAGSFDTAHEAELVKKLAEGRRVVVVTTAVHMPRAMKMFRAQGVDAVPAPCDYIAPVSDQTLADVNRWYWRPRGKNLSDSEETWHELLGLMYIGWFGTRGAEE